MTTTPGHPPLILIAVENEWSGRSLETVLGASGYAVVRAYTAERAMALAGGTHIDAIIVGSALPDMRGVEFIERLRQEPTFHPAVPIVLSATEPMSRQTRIEAHHAGAWEVVSQPVDAELLLEKLDVLLGAKRWTDRMRDACLLDPATGTYSARGLARRAQEIGAESIRRGGPLAAIVVTPQLDTPEEYVGELLPHMVEICRSTARVSDAIGHVGRGEFAILAPGTDDEGARRLVERLQQAAEGRRVVVGARRDRPLRIRTGFSAIADFADAKLDAFELLVRASSAMRIEPADAGDRRASAHHSAIR